MDATMYYGTPYQQQQNGYMNGNPMGYDPTNPFFNAQAMQFRPTIVPQNQSSLNNEELQTLKSSKPKNAALNLAIDQNEMLASICNHKENGRDVVVMRSDGSGKVFCPICMKSWNPEAKSKEEIQELVDELIDQLEIIKWTGDLPIEVIREFFTIEPLIEKIPMLAEYSAANFNKYFNQTGYFNAGDASIYAQYNSLFGPGAGYQQPFYPQQMQGQMPMAQYNSMMMGQPAPQQMGYYQQPMQAAQPAQQANPYVNPMQAPMNTQFTDQANMMMGGTMYAPGPQQPYTPVFAPQQQAAQAQAAQQAQPVAQQAATTAQATQPAAQQATTETKIEL